MGELENMLQAMRCGTLHSDRSRSGMVTPQLCQWCQALHLLCRFNLCLALLV